MRKRVQIEFLDESLTKQCFAEDCDVNNIMKKWIKTGELPGTDVVPKFGDFTNVSDYQESCNRVIEAQMQFEALDSKIRSRFANDPANLMNFLQDPSNIEEGIALGLLERVANPSDVSSRSESIDTVPS